MRTNIEIDDALMAEAIRLSEAPTKRAVVEQALQDFVRYRRRAELARDLRGKIQWTGDLEAMRLDDVA